MDSRILRGQLSQLPVHVLNQFDLSPVVLSVQYARPRKRGLFESVQEQRGAGSRPKYANPLLHRAGPLFNAGVALLRSKIREAVAYVRRDVPRLDREDDDVGVKRVETARGIKDLLRVVVEIGDVDRDIDAAEQGRGAQYRHCRLQGEGAED